ncbi:MAG: regulatory iron-sulfur-containing complex subunit RicT [Trueperaceae bacterium]|jgi:cell fate regulator YaaT (PSP1 superfamily)|nr:regulatory iron-sulfur-containing complex subunit RicT [Truepera sp.]HRQ10615.1 regulatory iron-sulfur-containing complex subunit RicT [Trueperaceae bacterium]
MPECIGVKFDNGPTIHYMEAPPSAPGLGTRCVVSTRRGLEMALVRTPVREVAKPHGHYVRDAQEDDVARYGELRAKAEELKWLLKARARQADADVKVVALEFNIDESLLVVSYTSEKQAPLRVLAQELVAHTEARIEFVNIGPRDQARMLGALGVCGDGTCSSTWLQSFNAVSIRMARDQQLPLNPEKISGPCGRLMCCLQFEHEMYRELLKGMPRKGAKACHDGSGTCGRVVKVNPLRGTVELRTDEGGMAEYPASELSRVRGGRDDGSQVSD